jgi:Rrf2 family protein
MKLITRDTDYALRSLCLIARDKGKLHSTIGLSRYLGIPRPFLRKILQLLSKKGILKSYRGNSGGFILSRDPRKILLTDLIKIFQGPFILNECSLKKHPCPNIKKCVLRRRISKIEGYVLKELKGITVACLLKAGRRNKGG